MRQNYDVIVVGAGVMGLFTAYELTRQNKKVLLLEKYTIGHAGAASSGLTRSIRQDYLDPFYQDLAIQAQDLWFDFEKQVGCEFYKKCGLINLASAEITTDLSQSYAARSRAALPQAETETSPIFQSDLSSFDASGGVLCLTTIRQVLLQELEKSNFCTIKENQTLESIATEIEGVAVLTQDDCYTCDKLIICSGKWVNDVIAKIENCNLSGFELSIQDPQEVRYYNIPQAEQKNWTSDVLPIFACLDIGVYGHPIVEGYTSYVKLSRYLPKEINTKEEEQKTIDYFVALFMPALAMYESFPVTDTDQCNYDFTADQDFIIGPIDEESKILVATGWNGTGYKFAPWVARYLCGMIVDPIATQRFNPRRFM